MEKKDHKSKNFPERKYHISGGRIPQNGAREGCRSRIFGGVVLFRAVLHRSIPKNHAFLKMPFMSHP